jgi:thioredoxin 1
MYLESLPNQDSLTIFADEPLIETSCGAEKSPGSVNADDTWFSHMRVLTTAPEEVRELLTHWTEGSSLVVVALCAAWCDTCNEFRASFERIAEARPLIVFLWLDIEDDSDVCGDIDVENFPTLAIYRGDALLHFGISLPQQGTVARLVDEMTTRTAGGSAAPDAVVNLPRTLRRRFA